jgi:hypothetical protein
VPLSLLTPPLPLTDPHGLTRSQATPPPPCLWPPPVLGGVSEVGFCFSSPSSDMSQTYLQFLMLYPCFYTICLVFRYTSWLFYAFSGTNLLTRCHSANSLFSVIFVFQKCYTGNILGIGRNKSQSSRNLPKLPENRRGDGEGPHSRAA